MQLNGFQIVSNTQQSNPKIIEFSGDLSRIEFPWDIFTKNDAELRKDFELLTKGKVFVSVAVLPAIVR